MATHFSNSTNLIYDVSTTVRAQAFVQFMQDALSAAGWAQTADTGQLVVASMSSGFTTANTKSGYQIWAMNDSLQATKPIVVRFDFGTGPGTNTPGLWITIGSGSNGSGTITGIAYNGGANSNATVRGFSSSNTSSPTNSYASGDGGAIRALLFASTSWFIFSLTRMVDATGAYTGDGVCMCWCENTGGTGALSRSVAIPYPGMGSAPTPENGVSALLANTSSSGYGGDVGVGVAVYFLGKALQPPGDVVVVNSGDYAAQAQFSMSVYGSSRTYQLSETGSILYMPVGNGSSQLRNNTRIGIRYD